MEGQTLGCVYSGCCCWVALDVINVTLVTLHQMNENLSSLGRTQMALPVQRLSDSSLTPPGSLLPATCGLRIGGLYNLVRKFPKINLCRCTYPTDSVSLGSLTHCVRSALAAIVAQAAFSPIVRKMFVDPTVSEKNLFCKRPTGGKSTCSGF